MTQIKRKEKRKEKRRRMPDTTKIPIHKLIQDSQQLQDQWSKLRKEVEDQFHKTECALRETKAIVKHTQELIKN